MKMRYNRMNMIQTPVSKNIYLSNVSYEYINVTLTASNYAGVVVIAWYLDLQLSIQSVSITTNVVSYIPAQAMCTRYNIVWYSLSVTCERWVIFSGFSGFLHQEHLPPRYNWSIVASGVTHHNLTAPQITLNIKINHGVCVMNQHIFLQHQYVCLHYALLEAFTMMDTSIRKEKFNEVWMDIQSDKRPINQQRINEEFKVRNLSSSK
jgi:hypothetical protein